jgi:hypothetical protein
MKRSGQSKRETQGLQKTAPETAISPTPATKEAAKARPKVRMTGPAEVEVMQTKPLAEMLDEVGAITGTHHNEAAMRMIRQVSCSLVFPRPKTAEEGLVNAIPLVKEMGAQNATEALLATQMIAAHEAALWFMARATSGEQTLEARDANVLRSIRLMRVFTEQLEAMQKLKGKGGQQKVTVELVHVYEGGQAIVGAVSTTKADPGEGGE